MLQRSFDCGDIYFKDYEGLYCIGCERFYTEKELLPGNICPVHNTPVERIKEGNYFLKLEQHREAIRRNIEKNPDFIRPERYRNEALRMLDDPLEDLCISRPKARLDWGITLPFDDKYVTYVWYDAFWAYLSELPDTSDASLKEILPVTEHFIGKDILKTHATYWPAMLLSAGLPLYRHLNVHGYLNFGGAKMSKSAGTIQDPVAYQQTLGPDVLRYFILREYTYGLDGDFTEQRVIDRYNSDLANDLGNLTSRVLTMAARYFNGAITATPGRHRPTRRRTGRELHRDTVARRSSGRGTRIQPRSGSHLASARRGQQIHRRDRAFHARQGYRPTPARRADPRQPGRRTAGSRRQPRAVHAGNVEKNPRPAERRRETRARAVWRRHPAGPSRKSNDAAVPTHRKETRLLTGLILCCAATQDSAPHLYRRVILERSEESRIFFFPLSL